MKKEICKDCKKFVRNVKQWDKKEIPGISLITCNKCDKCGMVYEINLCKNCQRKLCKSLEKLNYIS